MVTEIIQRGERNGQSEGQGIGDEAITKGIEDATRDVGVRGLPGRSTRSGGAHRPGGEDRGPLSAAGLDDLHRMLEQHGDWMPLGSADEQKPAAEGTVEAWARSPKNPVGGWYGLKKGLRGRFGMYVPPVMEAMGLAEVEHNPKNNRMRAR